MSDPINSNELVLVRCSVSSYAGQKTDRNLNRTLHDDGSSTSSTRVQKNLFTRESLKPLRVAASRVREEHASRTARCKINGLGVLTQVGVETYRTAMEPLADALKDAAADFVSNLQYHIDQAQNDSHLGKLFDPNDYPPGLGDSIRKHIGVDIGFLPMPDDNVFQASTDAIRQSVSAEVSSFYLDTIRASTPRLMDRLAIALERVRDRLLGKRLHESMWESLHELVHEIVPALNIACDDTIEDLCRDISSDLLSVPFETWKADRSHYSDIAGRLRAKISTDPFEENRDATPTFDPVPTVNWEPVAASPEPEPEPVSVAPEPEPEPESSAFILPDDDVFLI